MKYHKIRGVDLSVCTAEQKIAYNLAFSHTARFRDNYNALPTAAAKAQAVRDITGKLIEWYRAGYSYKPGKYDEDAIFSALLAGLDGYLVRPFIAGSYGDIGNAFPALYL